MSLLKDLSELVDSDVISRETADRIQDYYETTKGTSTNRLFIVFGILGALLIGLGMISIIAHNWDELSRVTKTIFAFLPLLAGQMICGSVLIKKQDSATWRESSAVFLFFSVGATISLVSQIYNIPGNLGPFLLTWMILCLPLIYVMKSSATSLLYMAGITYFAGETGYWSYPTSESYLYWLLLGGAMPHYYFLYKNRPESNFTLFHHWVVPISVIIALGTVANAFPELISIAYFSLFGLIYLVGSSRFFEWQKRKKNSYKILGSFGTIVLLLTLSFDWFWEDLRNTEFPFGEAVTSPEFFASAVITLSAAGLLYLQQKGKSITGIQPIAVVFILFIITFITGLLSPVAVVLINLIIFAIGLLTIRDGARQNSLRILNYGMLIITALIVGRFFDTGINFVIRGILFVSVGASFIMANYRMLNRRKQK